MPKIAYNKKPGLIRGKNYDPTKVKSQIWYSMQLSGACGSKRVVKAINKWLAEHYDGDWMYLNTGYGVNVIYSFPDTSVISNTEFTDLIEYESVIHKLSS